MMEENIEAEISLAISELRQIYNQVPQIRCDKCGSCCMEIGYPSVYSIEYMNMMRFLNKHKSIKRKIFAASLLIKVEIDKKKKETSATYYMSKFCPAFDPKAKLCSIYQQRPLDCRLYGLLERYKDALAEGSCGNLINSVDKQIDLSEFAKERKSLFQQLERLSTYKYLDKEKNIEFKSNTIAAWFVPERDGPILPL